MGMWPKIRELLFFFEAGNNTCMITHHITTDVSYVDFSNMVLTWYIYFKLCMYNSLVLVLPYIT